LKRHPQVDPLDPRVLLSTVLTHEHAALTAAHHPAARDRLAGAPVVPSRPGTVATTHALSARTLAVTRLAPWPATPPLLSGAQSTWLAGLRPTRIPRSGSAGIQAAQAASPLTVPQGGTGQAAFTAGELLVGNGTGPLGSTTQVSAQASGALYITQPGPPEAPTDNGLRIISKSGSIPALELYDPQTGPGDVEDTLFATNFADNGFPGPIFSISTSGQVSDGGSLIVSGHPTNDGPSSGFQQGTPLRGMIFAWNDEAPPIPGQSTVVISARNNGAPYPYGDGGNSNIFQAVEDVYPRQVAPGLAGSPGYTRWVVRPKGDQYTFLTDLTGDAFNATNYERFHQGWDRTTDQYVLETQAGGTGVIRNLLLQPSAGGVGIGTDTVVPNTELNVGGSVYLSAPNSAVIFDKSSGTNPYIQGTAQNQLDLKGGIAGIRFLNNAGTEANATLSDAGVLSLQEGLAWTSSLWNKALRLPDNGAIQLGSGATKYGIGADNNALTIFDTSTETASGAANPRLTISNGNVGINTATPGATLSVNGGVQLKRTAVAGDYTVLPTDYLVAETDTSSPRTILLPAANSVPAGQTFQIVDESGGAAANPITVAAAGADTIDGAATAAITTNYGTLKLYSDGVGSWFLV
jgi:hypothetical protein